MRTTKFIKQNGALNLNGSISSLTWNDNSFEKKQSDQCWSSLKTMFDLSMTSTRFVSSIFPRTRHRGLHVHFKEYGNKKHNFYRQYDSLIQSNKIQRYNRDTIKLFRLTVQ